MTSYIDNKIGFVLGLSESSVDGFLTEWAMPIILAVGAIILWHRWAASQLIATARSPSHTFRNRKLTLPAIAVAFFAVGLCVSLVWLYQANRKSQRLDEALKTTPKPSAAIAAQPSIERESRANSLLVQEKRLAQFAAILARLEPQIRAGNDAILKNEIERYKFFMTGRDLWMSTYYGQMTELKEATKTYLDKEFEIGQPKFSVMGTITPGEEEIDDPKNQIKYRQKYYETRMVNDWLDQIKQELANQQAANARDMAKFK